MCSLFSRPDCLVSLFFQTPHNNYLQLLTGFSKNCYPPSPFSFRGQPACGWRCITFSFFFIPGFSGFLRNLQLNVFFPASSLQLPSCFTTMSNPAINGAQFFFGKGSLPVMLATRSQPIGDRSSNSMCPNF